MTIYGMFVELEGEIKKLFLRNRLYCKKVHSVIYSQLDMEWTPLDTPVSWGENLMLAYAYGA